METLEEFLLDNDFEKFQIQENFTTYNDYIKKDPLKSGSFLFNNSF